MNPRDALAAYRLASAPAGSGQIDRRLGSFFCAHHARFVSYLRHFWCLFAE